MAGVLLDSSVYIRALRNDDEEILNLRSFEDEGGHLPIWLSAVVLQELYAGATQTRTQKLFRKVENNFRSVNRLIVPSLSDWIDAGDILCQLGKKLGFEQVGKSRISNDALIAMGARSNGLTLLTVNEKDFARIAGIRTFRWQVV